ncbi:MAG TPA: DUF234 domain-containing protein, partial [Pseudomonadales bacterium]|nr:DUF234 domain-containing protein [Pseudomonadales bacterium]
MPPRQRESTTKVHYHLRDPFLRFYFRFIEPNLDIIDLGNPQALWTIIADQFRSFVGKTAFEELCREWVLLKSNTPNFPIIPEVVGSHWVTAESEIDVAAVNWHTKSLLLGECKWTDDPVDLKELRQLVEKGSGVIPGDDWKVTYVLFSRNSFTPPAQKEISELHGFAVDLPALDKDLNMAL